MRNGSALLFSPLAHALLAWVCWRVAPRAAVEERQTEIVAAPPLSRARSKRPGPPAIGAKALSLTPDRRGPSLGFFRTPDFGEGFSGAPRAAEKSIERSDIYQRLYELIDGALEYPDELVDAKIEGFVSTTIRFSAEGHYLPKATEVKCASLYLQVIVRRALRRSLGRGPLLFLARLHAPFHTGATFEFGHRYHLEPAFYRRPGQRVEHTNNEHVDLSESEIERKNRRRALGDRLYFSRIANRIPSAKMMEIGSPDDHHDYLPAMDVLPWIGKAAERIDDWAHSRAKIDPLEKYRSDPDW